VNKQLAETNNTIIGSQINLKQSETIDNGTTTFIDDQPGEIVQSFSEKNIDLDLLYSTQSLGSQNIIDFLSKPVLLKSGVFTTTDTGYLWRVNTMRDLLTNVLYARKLNGIAYIRADLVFELRVNATRFQQGRYMLVCVNHGGVDAAKATRHMIMREVNLTTITQLPHVEIDLASQTSCVLKVPFLSSFNYISTSSQQYISTVDLVPYVALQAGAGDTTCSYDLYAHMENITLSGSIVSQSNKRGVVFAEQKLSSTGPVSAFMGKVSRTSSILGSIPFIAPFASTVSWTADIIGNAAKVWGWSKPTTVNPSSLYARQSHTQMALTDGTFVGHKFSATSSHSVLPHNAVARTDIDEMSIDFIKSQYAFFSSVVWPQSSPSGSMLSVLTLNPVSYNNTYALGRTFTPVAHLSNLFNLYRGGLKFRFKLVKTEFHSGRLLFAFLPVTPTNVLTPPILTISQTDNLMRQIVDIRTTNEVEIEVPFIADRNYINSTECYGFLYVFVMNQLVSPDNVNSDITILAEVAGANDLQFEQPMNTTRRQPYIPFQSDKTAIRFGSMGDSSDSLIYNQVSIGEKICSTRQLIKRMSPFGVYAGAFQNYFLMPFAFGWATQLTSNVTPVTLTNGAQDLISLLSGCYTFNTGGVRFAMTSDTYTNNSIRAEVIPRVDNNVLVIDSNSVINENSYSPSQYIQPNVEGSINVEVPYYSELTSRPNLCCVVGPSSNWPITLREDGAPGITLQWRDSGALKPYYFISRSGSEDFSFSGWLGVPPTIYI